MRQNRVVNQSQVLRNLLWLVSSLALAFFVWVIAVTEDAQERRFTTINVQVEHDPGLVIVEQLTRTVRVTVRAPQDILGLLTSEDITVTADLRGRGAGTYTVELDPVVSRSLAIADTQPRQITVSLEDLISQQVQIVAEIEELPPLNFDNAAPRFSESQVMVTGPASQVERVVAAVANFDLSNQRETVQNSVRLVPVDVDGNIVSDVVLDPQTVEATIEIRRRDGLEEVSVSPDIDIASLPDGYVISSILYDPSTVFVIGSPEELAQIPSTLFTEEIDLTNRTEDFEVEVSVVLPEEGPSLSFMGERVVRVSLVIDAQTTNVQLEDIQIIPIGLGEGLEATILPQTVSVLVTGPQPVLSGLSSEDIRVTVDLTGRGPGIYDVEALGTSTQISPQAIAILPPTIEVNIVELAETTGEPPS